MICQQGEHGINGTGKNIVFFLCVPVLLALMKSLSLDSVLGAYVGVLVLHTDVGTTIHFAY